MKKTFKIFLVFTLLVSVISYTSNAQQTDENTYIINQYFQKINTDNGKIAKGDLFNQQNINSKSNYNSEVAILQTGNYNSVNVKANPKKLDISQIGNSNNYEFITYYNSNKLNFEAQQIGNNNQLQVFGQNSIINNMKIVQFSNNKTITITNF
ncbi:hypothetical protein [Lutibacter flavus]|uniref:Curlin associated repeat-containing protein n=1 Tax=Lutibacter flavus TaxID=691689 RepID=A0A238ZLU9_9FLAO|nr:hypothetical protein [Lutibacter flavus]SNR84337.1 hypothetical protein SAMN04488111_3424 [Lutibacter flavus]